MSRRDERVRRGLSGVRRLAPVLAVVTGGLVSAPSALAGSVDGISVSANSSGLPGVSQAEKVVGACITYAVLALILGGIAAGIGWAWASHTSNPQWQTRSRGGLIGVAVGAMIVGGITIIISFFMKIGLNLGG